MFMWMLWIMERVNCREKVKHKEVLECEMSKEVFDLTPYDDSDG